MSGYNRTDGLYTVLVLGSILLSCLGLLTANLYALFSIANSTININVVTKI